MCVLTYEAVRSYSVSFRNCERVCAGFLERELITAASLPILYKTTWWASASYTSHPDLLQTASHHLRTLLFPLLLLSAHKLVTKARIQRWLAGSTSFRRTLHDLMKGISAAFWSLLDICFLEPPRSCWRQCSLRFLLLFVCWKHSAKANDVWPKPRMRNLKVLCCFILYCDTMSDGACHTLLCQWKCNERWDVSRTQNRCQCLHRDTTGLTSKVKLRDVSQ